MQYGKIIPPGERLGAVLSLGAIMDPAEIGAAIEALIARLDAAAGDPDFEDDGDTEDGNGSEDDFMHHTADRAAGCPIADSDQCEAYDDDPGRQCGDSQPGDRDDAEDEGDTELNGDETDHGWDPNA